MPAKSCGQARLVHAGGDGELVRGAALVRQHLRTGVEIVGGKIARHQFAVAVDKIAADERDGLRLCGAAAARMNKRHVDQAHAHQRERHDADRRPDDDAPLKDGGRVASWSITFRCCAEILTIWSLGRLRAAHRTHLRAAERRCVAAARQRVERGELHRRRVAHAERGLGQLLDALGTGHLLPLGLQHADLRLFVRRCAVRSG